MKPRENGELVGIVSGAAYGNRDIDRPCLWFTVDLEDGFQVLNVFSANEEAYAIVQDSGVYDVKDLNGRVCYMTKPDRNTARFSRWAS